MIIPRNDRVLIRRIEEPETKIGGIVVPDVARSKAIKGEVLAVGPGKLDEDGHRVPSEVHPGQIVLFSSKWNDLASTHYDDDKSALFDPLLHLIQEADILGIV